MFQIVCFSLLCKNRNNIGIENCGKNAFVGSVPPPSPIYQICFREIDLYYCSLSPQTREKMEEGAAWSVPIPIFSLVMAKLHV